LYGKTTKRVPIGIIQPLPNLGHSFRITQKEEGNKTAVFSFSPLRPSEKLRFSGTNHLLDFLDINR
jgi:hypothetical protein